MFSRTFISKNFLWIFIVLVLIRQSESKTLVKETVPIETPDLRRFDSKFVHHKQFFAALESGQDRFEIREEYQSTDGWNLSKKFI